MEVRSRRLEELERILKDLMAMLALSPCEHQKQLRLWIDLAILETRSQLEMVRTETVH
jgi:hypothetical protein